MDYIKAFVIGGLICVIGQVLIDKTKLTPARVLVLYVVVGVVLGGLGVYAPFKEFAGTGATTPLVGFGALLAEGTKDAINENGWTGIITGPLTAGAGGITVAILSGLVASLFFKPRSK